MDGKSLFDEMVNSDILMNEFRINEDNSFYLDAVVYVDGEQREFKVIGETFITNDGNNIIFIGDDVSGNFDIAYFAMESISDNTDLFITCLDELNIYDYALKIYIFKKESREISMFEKGIAEESFIDFIDFETLGKVEDSIVVWFIGWSKPVYETMSYHGDSKQIEFIPRNRIRIEIPVIYSDDYASNDVRVDVDETIYERASYEGRRREDANMYMKSSRRRIEPRMRDNSFRSYFPYASEHRSQVPYYSPVSWVGDR